MKKLHTRLHRAARTASPARPGRRPRGFTLVEVAVSLVLLALASGVIIAVLRQQIEQRKMADTAAILTRAQDALLAYVTAYGYLPCPAIAATNGVENAVVVGTTRTCPVETGFLPAKTLGMTGLDTAGLLESAWHDGAGNSNGTYLRVIRYSVATLAGTANAWAPVNPGLGAVNSSGIRTAVQPYFAGTGNPVKNNHGLFVCYSSASLLATNDRCGLSASNDLAPNVAAIIWSLGGDANDIASYSTDERQNYTPTVARVVISHPYIAKGAAGGPFDDQVSWISYPAIADRLVSAGWVQ
jgi:prepilin-type N-terminal cleavage/methylation domain-containing protein